MTGEGQRSLRTAGLLATSFCIALLWTIAAFTSAVPFPPTALAEAVIRAMPGDAATYFIELLGPWAHRLLTIGAVAGALLLGGEVGVRTATDRPRTLVAGSVLALCAAGAIVLGPADTETVPALVVALSVVAGVYAYTASNLFELLSAEGIEADPSRRRAMRVGVGATAGLAVAGGALGWVARRFGGPDTDVALVEPVVRATVPDRPSFPDIPGLTPEITSAEDHYVVDINLVQPSIEAVDWDLEVGGLVASPMTLTFEELQRRFDVVEEYATLTCISNEVGGDLVGHSLWGGVRLRDVLDAAGADGAAVDVVFRAEEGYSDSIPIELAHDPSVLLAISQNGQPLTQEHGFPCRVRIPQIYGMKNVKWLRSIEVVDSDYKGYWMERGWSDIAEVKTQSRIDVAGEDRRASVDRETWIAGIAWAGARGITKVEVSTDGGRSWDPARVKEAIGPYSWNLWAFRWTPEERGKVTVSCRATDGEGRVQTTALADPHPAGATGLHEVTVEVA